MRAYTGLVGWSLRHRYLTLLLGLAFFAGSIYSHEAAADRLPAGGRRRRARLRRSSCRPERALDDTKAVTDRRRGAPARACRKCARVFVNGGVQLAGQAGGAPGDLHGQPTSEGRARARAAASSRSAITGMFARRARHPLLSRSTTTASARLQLIVSGPRPERSSSRRRRSCSARWATIAAPREPAVDRAAEPARDPHPAQARRSRPSSASRPTPSPRRCASRTIGDIDANLAKFNAGDRQIPIRVQLHESARGDRQLLEPLKVPATNGAAVPLSAVADVELRPGADLDRPLRPRAPRRARAPTCDGTDALGEVLADDLSRCRRRRTCRPASRIRQTGDAEIMGEVFAGFAHGHGRRPA